MSKVKDIQSAIESLEEEEYSNLRKWFIDRDWEKWDSQIEADVKSGKLDFLIEEAMEEKSKGKLKDL